MKVLIASMMPTHPINVGNRARVAQVCAALKSLGNEVHFAHVKREVGDSVAMEEFHGRQFLHSCDYRPTAAESGIAQRLLRRTCAAFSIDGAFTYRVDDWYDPALDDFFTKLHSQHAFDIVIVEYVFLSRALQCFGDGVLKVIDTHDIFADRHKMYLAAGQRPGWFSTTGPQELAGLRRADMIVAIKEADCESLSTQLPDRSVVTLGHIVRTTPPITEWKARVPHSLLFVGNDSPLNTIALLYLIEIVMPIVRTRVPDARLLIAGNAGDAMHRPGAFEMLGVVPDIEEAYAKTWIAVNPVHAGTGLAIKSIEALGFAIPLVTTRTGARGLLDTGSAGFLCIPDHDAEAMAAAIVSLLCNEAARTRLSLEAWEYSRRWNERALQAVRSILHAGAKLGARSHEGQELR